MTIDSTERDPRVEAKFIEWNLEFRYESAFPLDKVRVADWAQVREKTNIAPRDTVEEYRMQMGNGAKFPPLVLMDPDIMIDGNTRRSAARLLHRKTFPAYIGAFATPKLAKAFAAALNNMGGKRLTAVEAAEAARGMMEQAFTDEAIAREIGRSVEQVRRIRSQAEFENRASALSLGAKIPDIRVEDRISLNAIKHNAPLAEAIELIANVRPDRITVRELVKNIEAAPSDADAIDVVAAARAALRPAGPPPHRPSVPPAVQQVNMHLGGLLRFSDDPVAILDMREEQREPMMDKWRKAVELGQKVLDLYGARQPVSI